MLTTDGTDNVKLTSITLFISSKIKHNLLLDKLNILIACQSTTGDHFTKQFYSQFKFGENNILL